MRTSPAIPAALLERLRLLRAFLFDVDGVLSDTNATFTSPGFETKAFNVHDGHAIKLAQEHGLRIGIITAHQSQAVVRHARELAIADVYQGHLDKQRPFEEFKTLHALEDCDIGYMGDDILDLSVLTRVGFAATPADAHPSVRMAAHFVSTLRGGHGAVREVLELVLRAQQ
jgi:3-deoxy-D-manno-octulosonate 8-phosphate phosphatase (KDO 8-P phosphatase)